MTPAPDGNPEGHPVLAAICVPEFSASDLAAVQAIRETHDAGYAARIAPHVTLVFPTGTLSEADFGSHADAAVRDFSACEVRFRSAVPYMEPDSERCFVFLVPLEGADWCSRLHASLHAGPLQADLDPRRPYVPHMTVARCATLAEASSLSEGLHAAGIDFRGTVRWLDIVRVGVEFETVRRIGLPGNFP